MLTIPNFLTLLRLILLIPFSCLLINHEYVWALVLILVVGGTDWLDGKLARLLNQQSQFGVVFDPLVDRIYMLIIPVLFAVDGLLSWWVLVIIFLREILLLPSVIILKQKKLPFLQVTYLGKAATFALMNAFPIILAAKAFPNANLILHYTGFAILTWGIFLSWWTFIYYWQITYQLVNKSKLVS